MTRVKAKKAAQHAAERKRAESALKLSAQKPLLTRLLRLIRK